VVTPNTFMSTAFVNGTLPKPTTKSASCRRLMPLVQCARVPSNPISSLRMVARSSFSSLPWSPRMFRCLSRQSMRWPNVSSTLDSNCRSVPSSNLMVKTEVAPSFLVALRGLIWFWIIVLFLLVTHLFVSRTESSFSRMLVPPTDPICTSEGPWSCQLPSLFSSVLEGP
jgi:hypothetical protein